MWILINFVKFLAIGYVALVCLVFIFQRNLMYHPIKTLATPEVIGLSNVQEVFTNTSDGIKLQIWTKQAQAGFPTIVYFHGNAGDLADRAAKFSTFIDAGFGLVAVSYRGYGKSEGVPTEQGIYSDARAAIDYAINEMYIPQNRLIYFGESLGTGVAVQMASERPPALLMLEAAYTSVETRSAELYPFIIGVRILVLDKYDSLAKIANVHAPLLMIHGTIDPIIPIAHGKKLFAAANEPKNLVVYQGVHHVDYSNEQILNPLLETTKKLGLTPNGK